MPEQKDIPSQTEQATPELTVEEQAGSAAAAPEDDHGHDAMGVEGEGVNAGLILGIATVTMVIVVAVVAIAFSLAVNKELELRDSAAAAAQYPERVELDAEALQQLSSYGAVGDGTYRMPIDRAISLMVDEGANADEDDLSDELTVTAAQ